MFYRNEMIENINQNSVILILGLGISGKAVAHWFAKNNIPIRLVDQNLNLSITKKEFAKYKNIDYVINHNNIFSVLHNVSKIVVSPGISLGNSSFSNLLNLAIKNNIEIISEIEVFAQALLNLKKKNNYQPKVIAITGTNGKTTVTTLTSFLINSYGLYAVAVGNIGKSAISVLEYAIISNNLPDVWVIELSSFQLTTTYNLHIDVATILNISPDHIDWHLNLDNYIKSKISIAKNAKILIINRDDEYILNNLNSINSKNIYSFGISKPKYTNDMGIINHNCKKLLVSYHSFNKYSYIIDSDLLFIKGIHNYLNVLAALLLIRSIGIPIEKIFSFLPKYLGESHRNTFICRINNVDYINDSKATNIGATIAALNSYNNKKVLILGGISKGQDFSLLLPFLKNIRIIILIGIDAYHIAKILDNDNITYIYANNMKEAVIKAYQNACEGDIVLLSPACSSLDMFSSYKQRGETFSQEVLQLAKNSQI
ncbi:UDP-N-acetylmuramoylalanine--D-glutamate ligase [Candidatus Kinetoplastibacterium sorsogonicusi]|uniref:UDP-N-acetylmuramoylalanine--D-glutamate ligase n=1 Tax=Candidatus Kinetoplastidibacterium kentomonadis TaxID=1576550 RepID=A0A3Q8EYD0_9PROT|nr:UDP-N-acetylmuramoyl-L-alanine--D-glutamate ligase [Candidatus Kinetoplastibacterium sorsogonicusi]AWD32660.1 UDP-N-acetylmuramoylalanine--D-glutamate ligase [Candidatus Kinetoplastibacterium sorsogonicusi]